jgi:hypothetical protein
MPAVIGEDNFPIQGFTGLNDSLTPEFISDHELALANNFLLEFDGSLRKRFPTLQFTSLNGTGPHPLQGIVPIGQLLTSSGFTGDGWTIFHDASNWETYYTHDMSTTTTNIGTLSGQIIYDSVQYNGKLYISGENGLWEWQSSGTITLITAAPHGFRSVITFRDRIFGIVGDALYWSEPGDPTNWPVDNILYVNPKDGSEITGLQVYGDSLILPKQNTWWQLHFADDPQFWFLRGVNDTVGCSGPHALVMCENLLYFIDRRGLWVTDTVNFTMLWNLNTEDTAFQQSVSFDILGNHVSVFKDWIVYHYKGIWTRAFHFRPPRGFTTLSWVSVNFWGPIFEQKSFNAPSNWLLSIGTKLYRFVDFATSSSEVVSCQMLSKAYDITRTSRYKQLMRGTLLTKGPGLTSTAQYRWRKDEQLYDAYRAMPSNSKNSTSIRLQSAGRARTFQLDVIETSNEMFAIFGFNLVLQLEHDQAHLAEAN